MIVFKNTENIVLVFFENICFLNLMFFIFFVFSKIKKKIENLTCFSYSPCFGKRKPFSKSITKQTLTYSFEIKEKKMKCNDQ